MNMKHFVATLKISSPDGVVTCRLFRAQRRMPSPSSLRRAAAAAHGVGFESVSLCTIATFTA